MTRRRPPRQLPMPFDREVPAVVLLAREGSSAQRADRDGPVDDRQPIHRTGRAAQGLSFFGEVRQGRTGWAGVAGADYFQPDVLNENDWRRRYVFGGAHWSQLSHGRLGVVITLDQTFQGLESELTGRVLRVQTHVRILS